MHKLHQKIFQRLFKGFYLKELEQLVKSFLDLELTDLFYKPVLQKLEEAKQRGDYTVILSASPDFLVQPIANALGVTDWRASVYIPNQNGRLEHLSTILDGIDKAAYVSTLIQQMSLDNSAVTAFSDSYLDLPLLEIAGKAIGVVPDKKLKKICEERGWEIL
jgi:HAD superfamily phosphoserine phosphatase-like hydrolase